MFVFGVLEACSSLVSCCRFSEKGVLLFATNRADHLTSEPVPKKVILGVCVWIVVIKKSTFSQIQFYF